MEEKEGAECVCEVLHRVEDRSLLRPQRSASMRPLWLVRGDFCADHLDAGKTETRPYTA